MTNLIPPIPLVLILFLAPLPASLQSGSTNLQDVEVCGGFVTYKYIQNQQIQYLLMKDAKHGAWELPGGHLEGNGTVIQAALREMWEETGWKIYRDYQADFRSEIYFVYKRENGVFRHVHLWPAVLTNLAKEVKISEEHSEHKWMEFWEAVKTIHPSYKVGFIRAHEIIIGSHRQ